MNEAERKKINNPQPLKLYSHEVSLWSQVYAARIAQSGEYWAALTADDAVRKLRLRYTGALSTGPFR